MIAPLPIVYGPNEIFKKKAAIIDEVNEEIRIIADRMVKTLNAEHAIGIAGNMVGILKRIIVVKDNNKTLIMINPCITWADQEHQLVDEASISFPGISASISRPKSIQVQYIDYDGNSQELVATGLLATVIQHEIDYLDGKTYLDHISKLKSSMLLKKMMKYMKFHKAHVHSEHCQH